MSQVIELKEEVYTKLKAYADKRGVTPEIWIEIIVDAGTNNFGMPTFSEKELQELSDFQNRKDEKIKNDWKRKFQKELLSVNE